ncbi:hypothetical protein OPV22_002881 [Ensete ventricosum]|uniref:Uncharacterized protein n=1 Tax=Ensete ventricosum TaxID=4639 RepID=A0AAV8RZ18_ENSVE|nr:hypothetical protein OPV22_002881 [Ensete ventricosum]
MRRLLLCIRSFPSKWKFMLLVGGNRASSPIHFNLSFHSLSLVVLCLFELWKWLMASWQLELSHMSYSIWMTHF